MIFGELVFLTLKLSITFFATLLCQFYLLVLLRRSLLEICFSANDVRLTVVYGFTQPPEETTESPVELVNLCLLNAFDILLDEVNSLVLLVLATFGTNHFEAAHFLDELVVNHIFCGFPKEFLGAWLHNLVPQFSH